MHRLKPNVITFRNITALCSYLYTLFYTFIHLSLFFLYLKYNRLIFYTERLSPRTQ